MKSQEIERLYKIASKELKDKENFPGHYLYKKIEIENILKKVTIKENSVSLEIGCGNGFQSALLGCFSKRLIATDLYYFDPATHTVGMARAKDLNRHLDRKNVEFTACSATALPFKRNSFDFILINSALEHIQDKKRVIDEISYALVPGGIVVVGVPNFMTDIFLFFHLYLYILRRLFDAVCAKIFRKHLKPSNIFSDKQNYSKRGMCELWKAFRKNYPFFPFPMPHGDWRDKAGKLSFFEEFKNSFPWKWAKLLKGSGLRVTNTFALLFVPFPVFEPFSTRMWVLIHNSIKRIHFILCSSIIKNFSVTHCLVAVKELS